MVKWIPPLDEESEQVERELRNAKRRTRRRLKRRLAGKDDDPTKKRLCLKCRKTVGDKYDHLCPRCTKQNQGINGKVYAVGTQQ